MEILGIDIGGTGIKGATVDVQTGQLTSERCRLLTPQPATPEAVCATVGHITQRFDWHGAIGCGFPAVIREGKVMTAAHISSEWLGCEAAARLREATGCEVFLLNDADAAGHAEMTLGAGRSVSGLVLIATLGTGIGTALFFNGQLIPNTELGHIEINGREAEQWASAVVKEKKKLSWKKWARRLNVYLARMEAYFWPDLIIIGGGLSKKAEKFLPLLRLKTRVVPAQMRNEAGIVGAALAAAPRASAG